MNIKNLFRTRYRVVRDRYLGYEVQFRHWWMPFYIQGEVNTHTSLDKAINYIQLKKKSVVYVE
jgi:hypothetical protein